MGLYDILIKSNNPAQVYTNYINYTTSSNYIPFSASLELTPICNLNCEMCYIRRTQEEIKANGERIMSFSDWKYYIDGLAKLGVKHFTLTGGECMLHPDFEKIYEYSYDLGIQITLITNGSALTEKILEVLDNRPPYRINITIYGSSKEVYERFCDNGAAFDRVIQNIDTLIEHKMPVVLQCTIGKDNIYDYKNIYAIAKKRNLLIIANDALMTFDKCDDNKMNNVQVDTFEFNIINNNLHDYHLQRFSDEELKGYVFPINSSHIENKGLECVATRSRCSIDWKGRMRPCVGFEALLLNPRENGGIEKCWHKLVDWGKEIPVMSECEECICYYECQHCVALHYNDTHEFGKPSPRLCFKVQHPEEAAKLQAEYDRRQALKKAEETEE